MLNTVPDLLPLPDRMSEGFNTAMTNRSLRTVKTVWKTIGKVLDVMLIVMKELEFLLDANVITSEQFELITAQLPANASSAARSPLPTPSPQPPAQQMANLSFNQEPVSEKKTGYYAQDTGANAPPPAYPTPPVAPAGPPTLAYASATYQYNAQDAGDLALMPNDKVVVTEYMNNEWWKGRNERTGQEGIFPASYVRKEDRAVTPVPPMQQMAPYAPPPSNYGNMPMDVAGGSAQKAPTKTEENTKKFGKKLGNAAVFGAGATIGSKIVHGIF